MNRSHIVFYLVANSVITAGVLLLLGGAILGMTVIASVQGPNALLGGSSLLFWGVLPFSAGFLFILGRRLLLLIRALRSPEPRG